MSDDVELRPEESTTPEEEARRRARADMRTAMASALWPAAVRATQRKLGPLGVRTIRTRYATLKDGWWTRFHLGSGMAYRNWLREHGYGEHDFGIGNLDNIYVRLLEEAAGVKEATKQYDDESE